MLETVNETYKSLFTEKEKKIQQIQVIYNIYFDISMPISMLLSAPPKTSFSPLSLSLAYRARDGTIEMISICRSICGGCGGFHDPVLLVH